MRAIKPSCASRTPFINVAADIPPQTFVGKRYACPTYEFWLHVDFVLGQFAAQRARAIEHYVAFVHEGTRAPSVRSQLQGQIYLGLRAFIEKMQTLVDKYLSGQHTMSAIAAHFSVHYTTVSRLVKAYEADQKV